MPNWITNKVKAPPAVISGMLNAEGQIDFNIMMPSPTPYGKDWEMISIGAETAAEAVMGVRHSDDPVLAVLQLHNRERIKVAELSDEDFEQFVGMIRNLRACGFLHSMDFARKVWGTKWNACEQTVFPEEGSASFDTAWSCPIPVLEALSKRFPDDEISIEFADEDLGSNCGTFTLKNGDYVRKDLAPNWQKMDEEERAKWVKFARDVKGWEAEDEEE